MQEGDELKRNADVAEILQRCNFEDLSDQSMDSASAAQICEDRYPPMFFGIKCSSP
jgi:hypothetical protein